MNHRFSSNIYNVGGKFLFIIVGIVVEIAWLLLEFYTKVATKGAESPYTNMPA